jgi:steroid delta-isomerase-like uncharacterized protein
VDLAAFHAVQTGAPRRGAMTIVPNGKGVEYLMSEENKALERRMYEEIFNKKNTAAIEQFYAADWVCHPSPPGMPSGLDGMKQWHTLMNKAFPDMQVKLEDIVAEGDKMACLWTATATHKGEFMSMPPTNKQVTITGLHIDRVTGGKIAETWNYSDMMGVMQQLGMKPPG